MVSESWEIKWFVSGKFGGMHVFDARRAAEWIIGPYLMSSALKLSSIFAVLKNVFQSC